MKGEEGDAGPLKKLMECTDMTMDSHCEPSSTVICVVSTFSLYICSSNPSV